MAVTASSVFIPVHDPDEALGFYRDALGLEARLDVASTRCCRWYTGLLDPIRKAFAMANGVKPALFSANSEDAYPACKGAEPAMSSSRGPQPISSPPAGT
jgi:catechol 2,3-dioxygenase-like lactoylglutathione lyase family enzyme